MTYGCVGYLHVGLIIIAVSVCYHMWDIGEREGEVRERESEREEEGYSEEMKKMRS